MNVKINAFEKVEMELIGLDFHLFHILNPIFFITKKK